MIGIAMEASCNCLAYTVMDSFKIIIVVVDICEELRAIIS